MSNSQPLIEHLAQRFSERNVENCITKSDATSFEIVEIGDNAPCKIELSAMDDAEIMGFKVENPHCKLVFLLALDHCFFNDTDPVRCDFAIFDSACICFVELKLNVTRFKQIGSANQEGRKQLGETIRFFMDTSSANLGAKLGYRIEAFLAMRRYPRRPDQAVRERFYEEYGVVLFEESKKAFN